jgi:hypothetical protein
MSRKTLGEQFADSRGGPISFRGLTVHSIHEIAIARRATLAVRFVDSTKHVVQGLRLAVDGGTLLVNDQTLLEIVLWEDTAPRRVRIQVTPTPPRCVVKMWKVWRDETGAMQAWIGDCGMVVEPTSSGVRLKCSDGADEAAFDDLVVRVDVAD